MRAPFCNPEEDILVAFQALQRKFDRAKHKLEMAGLFGTSLWRGFFGRERFDKLRIYCMFVGYPRSGHSIVGSLLDAHSNIVIAHEFDALRYVRAGFGKRQIFHLLLDQSERFTASGRVWTGYTYVVPGQWQGKFEDLHVIGDKKGGVSTLRLRDDPTLLDRLRDTVQLPVKVIHVVRNPYDNVATMTTSKQKGPKLEDNIAHYRAMCETVDRVRSQLDEGSLLEVRHESLIASPRNQIAELCEFLMVSAPSDYVDACAGTVLQSPSRTRHKITWNDSTRAQVEELVERFEFLAGYGFED